MRRKFFVIGIVGDFAVVDDELLRMLANPLKSHIVIKADLADLIAYRFERNQFGIRHSFTSVLVA